MSFFGAVKWLRAIGEEQTALRRKLQWPGALTAQVEWLQKFENHSQEEGVAVPWNILRTEVEVGGRTEWVTKAELAGQLQAQSLWRMNAGW